MLGVSTRTDDKFATDPPLRPKKLKNGMIAVTDGTISATAKKWLDVEVTNRWPLVALGARAKVLSADLGYELEGEAHLSLRPDLRLHVTTPTEHIFFDARPAWAVADGEATEKLRWFTAIGKPFGPADLLTGGKHRVWHQGALVSPFLDDRCDPTRTRLFLDFFLHTSRHAPPTDVTPPALPMMRPAYDRHGCTLGPFRLATLHRRQPPPGDDLLITFRFGFVELDDATPERIYIHTSLPVYERRPRAG
jgi:hypothetical protein